MTQINKIKLVLNHKTKYTTFNTIKVNKKFLKINLLNWLKINLNYFSKTYQQIKYSKRLLIM